MFGPLISCVGEGGMEELKIKGKTREFVHECKKKQKVL
jgi:hypothetical protein